MCESDRELVETSAGARRLYFVEEDDDGGEVREVALEKEGGI
jgi:hypothetical protein